MFQGVLVDLLVAFSFHSKPEKQREYVWDWVPANGVASLPVTWRFGKNVCKLLRKVSTFYGKGNG